MIKKKTNKILVLFLSMTMILTSIFSMPLSYADTKEDEKVTEEAIQVDDEGCI